MARLSDLVIFICTAYRVAPLERILGPINVARQAKGKDVSIPDAANNFNDSFNELRTCYLQVLDAKRWLTLIWFAEPRPWQFHILDGAMPPIECDVMPLVDEKHLSHADYMPAICTVTDAHPNGNQFFIHIGSDDGIANWVDERSPHRTYPLPSPNWDLCDTLALIVSDVSLPGSSNLLQRRRWCARVFAFPNGTGPNGHDLECVEDADLGLRAPLRTARLQHTSTVVQCQGLEASRVPLSYLTRIALKCTLSILDLHEPIEVSYLPRSPYRKLALCDVISTLIDFIPSRRRCCPVSSAETWSNIADYYRVPTERSITVTTRTHATDHYV